MFKDRKKTCSERLSKPPMATQLIGGRAGVEARACPSVKTQAFCCLCCCSPWGLHLASGMISIYTLSSGSLDKQQGELARGHVPSPVPGTGQTLAICMKGDRIKGPWAGLHQRP